MAENMDSRYAQLGEAIRTARTDRGYSQRDLALMIGHSSSYSYIYRVENGRVKISLEQLMKIADALDVRVVDLIDF